MYEELLANLAERVDVVVTRGEYLHHVAIQGHAAHLMGGGDGGDEVEGVVALPNHVGGIVVKRSGLVLHRAILAVPHKEPLFVTLVACTTHTAEGNHLVVGAPNGIFVITRHLAPLLADVAGCGSCYVVDEDVRVGRNSVGGTCEVFAGVGQSGTCIVPSNLLAVEVGSKGGIPRLTLHNIFATLYNALSERCDEDVGVVTLIPIVPVAYHQIVVDASLRFVGLGIYVGAFDIDNVHLLGV